MEKRLSMIAQMRVLRGPAPEGVHCQGCRYYSRGFYWLDPTTCNDAKSQGIHSYKWNPFWCGCGAYKSKLEAK